MLSQNYQEDRATACGAVICRMKIAVVIEQEEATLPRKNGHIFTRDEEPETGKRSHPRRHKRNTRHLATPEHQ